MLGDAPLILDEPLVPRKQVLDSLHERLRAVLRISLELGRWKITKRR